MSGIAGWIDYNKDVSEEIKIIEKMSNSLKERGPDENGVYKNKNACMIHRRLVVLDPENGKQPMYLCKNFGNYVIVCDGKIYNTKEIQNELIEQGYKFRSHSDTEIILAAFACWKEKCLEKLNGVFAFAVFNKDTKEVFFARDRMGIKPLFFYEYEGGLVFGSEIKTLLSNPFVESLIDEEGLNEIFFLGPGRTLGKGVIKGVQELKPAEYVYFSEKGLKRSIYWKIVAREFTDNIYKAEEKTRYLIKDSIEKQMVSDIPIFCFLSGGLDSSIVFKIASDYYKENGKEKLSTFSVDYIDNAKYFIKNIFQPNTDKKYIEIMLKEIESNHTFVTLDSAELAGYLKEATLARGLPGMGDIDSSLFLFCKEINKKFTIGLSGECSDEIFGGYPWYHDEKLLYEESFPWSRNLEIRRKILKDGLLKNGEEYVQQMYLDTVNSTDKLPSDTKLDARMREMFILNINWFMQTLIERNDRMSASNGLEVRVPFCDYRIVEYAFNMPWGIKAYEGREKGILRKAMNGILPDKIVNRKKSPYPKTHNPIYMKMVAMKVREILEDKNSMSSQMFSKEEVLNIIENPDKINIPWYGQLMGVPQILAYIIQIDCWFKEYNVKII